MFFVCTDYICYSICAGCDNEIGHGEFLNLKDGIYPWYFRCYACDQPIIGFDVRMPKDTSYIRMDDRVMLCLECLESSIKDTVECQPLYQEIQKFYKGLNMKFDQEIQLLLVERAVIRVQTGSFLAHEIMHAWLRINGYGKLDPHVEEGICDVMSYMWLDSEIMSISGSNVASSSSSTSSTIYINNQSSQFQRKLAQICKYKMENRKVPIYGKGFNAGYAAVLKYGLKNVLNHIKMKGSFPF
ncbi:Protein DA1-related 1 [Platanthera guangdongensis]|uniref:Protein DA1-related 1 n=1 Tax=Platanthera guangdongensis TaxID=2320717 RepID=A0ABR2MWS6_9ASPA